MENLFLSPHWGWFLILALAIHQIDEHLWPGRFRMWWNRTIFQSGHPENFPLSPKGSLLVNGPVFYGTGIVWAALGSLLGQSWVPLIFVGLFLADASLHVSYTIATGEYSPGTATGLVLYYPLIYLAINIRLEETSSIVVVVALLLGILSYSGLYLLMRRVVDSSSLLDRVFLVERPE